MPGNIGPLEIAVVLIIVLIIFGPKRLPELGRSIGRGIREFRNSIGGGGDRDKDDVEEKQRELEAADAQKGATPPETPASTAGTPTGTPAQPEGGGEPASPARGPAHGGTTPSGTGGATEPVEGEIVSDERV